MGVYEFTEEELADSIPSPSPEETVGRVARRFGLTVEVLTGSSKELHLERARRVLYQELRASGLSYPTIGRLAKRHHTTISKVLKRIRERGAA